MTIGIDAAGVRGGGSYVYLKNLLELYEPEQFPEIEKIIVWGKKDILDKIDTPKIVEKVPIKIMDSFNPFLMLFWKLVISYYLAPKNCDILYVPGAIIFKSRIKKVVMFQNLLPFDHEVRKLYKGNLSYYKYILLEKLYKYSYKHADGIIFPTNFTKEIIECKIKSTKKESTVIYHSLGKPFLEYKKERNKETESSRTLKLLCVSTVAPYKGQFELLDEFSKLIGKGWDVSLSFVGSVPKKSQKSFFDKIDKINLKKKVFTIWGILNMRKCRKFMQNMMYLLCPR